VFLFCQQIYSVQALLPAETMAKLCVSIIVPQDCGEHSTS
jgi:hypothetical protein